MAREIFISYSRKDLDKVKAIREELEQATGVECWMDLEGIESGNPNFVKAIVNGIIEAKVFLFMLSNASQSSEYALGEADLARNENKEIIFVNIDNCVLTREFRLVYGRSNMINWNVPFQHNKLLKDLKKLLGIKEETTSVVFEVKQNEDNEARRKEEEVRQRSHDKLHIWHDIFAFSFLNNIITNHKKTFGGILCGFIIVIIIVITFPTHETDDRVVLHKIEKNGLYGYADRWGKIVIPCQWAFAWDFSEGFAPVKNEKGQWGFIDQTGKIAIPCQWKWCYMFSEGFASVTNEEEMAGYIDYSGEVIIPCQWKKAGSFSEGLAEIENEHGDWGYIDKTGKEVVICRWKEAWSFHEGLAKVKNEEGKWGYIDKNGIVIIACKWKNATNFSKEKAKVKDMNGKWWIIDKTGKIVREAK